MATQVPVTLDTPIVVKIQFRGQNKKFKLPLKDLGAHVLPEKLRAILQVTADQEVIFERYSDSVGAYVTLDSNKPQVYKTLFRAAKAKLKLRLRATIPGEIVEPATAPVAPAPPPHAKEPINTEGVSLHRLSSDTLTPHGIAPISPVIAYSPGPCPPAPKFEVVSPVSPPVPPKVQPDVDEAPVPRSFTARQSFFSDLAQASYPNLAIRPKPAEACTSWVVYCNNCNQPMEDAHFHCSICDGGDYDLCPSCVDSGVHCPGTGHWMVKRFVKNGCIVNSTTERVGPKIKREEQEIPGAFTDEKQSVTYENEEPTRTCNSCVKVLPEKEFVTCGSCDDYDLCLDCHVSNKHGHHPGHAFKAATGETVLQGLADYLCNAGRNVRHSAVCDGCDKFIYGVRHKCLNCPDWDYCSECIRNAKFIHPRHRFVPIYEPLAEPFTTGNRHYGIYCDGPLCKDKENLSYIEGVRYKCAVCHDTDFCQNCESHPTNKHNHTHPLIKFKTPVRSVSVTTLNEDKSGKSITRVGDREQPSRRSTATETSPVAPSTNAATQVQTILDMKPSEAPQPKNTKEKIEIRDLLAEPVKPVQEKISVLDLLSSPVDEPKPAKTAPVAVPKPASPKNAEELDAHFIRDTIADGSKICAGFLFVQVWTLRNPGPNAWPAGCSVRHVGGDNMLNIDNTQPLSQSELDDASESNVMGRTVEPGEEISFRVVMKAPKREGTAISYWRLKTSEGIPFGHRLWCDIQVIAPPCPAPSSAETSEASSSSSTPTMTPFERLQQAKLERIRLAQSHAQQYRQQQPEADKDLQAKLTEMVNEEKAKVVRAYLLRKSAVERIIHARHKEYEATLAAMQPESDPEPEKVPEVSDKQPTAELPVEPQPHSSGMIFPQLEKESPTSSTHDVTVPPESPMSERSTIAATVTVRSSSDDEFFEDAESVDIRSVSDDGFMTDEEYDILDASDEEMP